MSTTWQENLAAYPELAEVAAWIQERNAAAAEALEARSRCAFGSGAGRRANAAYQAAQLPHFVRDVYAKAERYRLTERQAAALIQCWRERA